MRLLVIGAGMMGSAAAYDMARSPQVESVTLADLEWNRVRYASFHAVAIFAEPVTVSGNWIRSRGCF